MRKKLGDGRVADVDFTTPRLLCIAGQFMRQDEVAAQNSRRRIELLRYRRYGDAFMALEWVYGGEAVVPTPQPAVSPRRAAGKEQAAVAPHPEGSPDRSAGEDPDYSRYPPWNKAREETRKLFLQLETLVESFGNVRTDAFKTEISFKCLDAPGKEKVIAYVVTLFIREVRIRLIIAEKHLRDIPLEDGFSRPYSAKGYRELTVRDDADIRRAGPLLRAAYDSLSEHGDSPTRSAAARKAWATRRSQ